MAEPVSSSTEGKQPSYMLGCVILGVAGFFGVLLGIVILVGVTLNKEIGKFTEKEAVTQKAIQPTPEQAAAVDAKLKALVQAATDKKGVEIPITAEDVNVLIATQPLLEDQRGKTWVESITPRGMRASMSSPMRDGLFGMRYLNASFDFVPEKLGNGWQLTLKDIQAPGKAIPPQFIQVFSETRMFKFDPRMAGFKVVLPQLKEIRLENGQAVVVTYEGPAPVEGKGK